jgi:SAM-dependent methyltransferase
MESDPTKLFTRRAREYARYRPRYPAAILGYLEARAGLSQETVIADVGSGTGILTVLFAGRGFRIFGVEPNDEMRTQAEVELAGHGNFTSVNGAAEATTLADRCVDLITVGQAFHWFEPAATSAEFRRILRPQGYVVLLWNRPRRTDSAFYRALSALHDRHELHRPVGRPDKDKEIQVFFGGKVEKATFDNRRFVDWEQFRGRFLSASWAPRPEAGGFDELMADLDRLFETFAEDGRLLDDLVTELYLAQFG